MKNCQSCGNSFDSPDWRLKTCSEECSKKLRLSGLRRRRASKKIPLKRILCVVCNKEFIPSRKKTLCCSSDCSVKRKTHKTKEWNSLNSKRASLRKNYDLSLEDVENILQKQNYRCAVCEKILSKFFIDHNHKTGKVRGILCFNCNTALGKFEDNPELLAKAIIYLSKENQYEEEQETHARPEHAPIPGDISKKESFIKDSGHHPKATVLQSGTR